MNKELLVISAVWCPSCLVLNKHLKKIENEYKIKINKLDFDLDEEEVKVYNVGDKLPVMILKDEEGKEIKRTIGEKNYAEIVSFIEED
ncbi:MAG: thioredoxin family protein [Bacilli bacterium]|nr:thioredoxin family protein [Bacilli bacterium]